VESDIDQIEERRLGAGDEIPAIEQECQARNET
jgi:hypothetical protein